jgi:predicted transcriptional regulator
MHSLGFGKKTISNVFREFIKDGLILEKGILYDISEKGVLLAKHLMKTPTVANWYNSVYMFQNIEMPKRKYEL